MARVMLQAAVGVIAVAVVTAVSFRLHLTLAEPLCLDLIVVVILSLWGNFASSAFVSIVAVGCLDYYFTLPLFSVQILDPLDGFAIVLFLLTAAVITTLVSRLRVHASELSIANAKLAEQIDEVKRAQDQLELARVNRVMLMGEMSASIAHEINQPLTGILANAGTALRYLDRDLPDLGEVRRYLAMIARDGRRAGDVTHRIRALAKKEPPNARPLDLNETVREALALTERDLQAKHVRLETVFSSELPPVPADRVQLQQVMLNLIVNALEALGEPGPEPREVKVTSGIAGSTEVFVEVCDSGPGIDAASADRLFTTFYTTKPNGMGMGLAISRAIVEAHGGRLVAHANDPTGAVFRVILPTAERDG